jgi:hypothetical protein
LRCRSVALLVGGFVWFPLSFLSKKSLIPAVLEAVFFEDVRGDMERETNTPRDGYPIGPVHAVAADDVDSSEKFVHDDVGGKVPHDIGVFLHPLASPLLGSPVVFFWHYIFFR